MKICLVCTRFIKNKMGGVERVTFKLAKEFRKQGHEVLILTRKFNKEDKNFEKIEGIPIKRVSCINISGLRTITSLFNIYRYLKKNPADINNPQDWSPTLIFLLLRKIPYVMTSHGFSADYDNPNKIAVFMEKLVLSLSKKPIICVQKRSKTDYLKRFEFIFIPNGVNTNEFKASNKVGKYALFVGSIDERKNITGVCQSFDYLRKKGIKIPLKVVGGGPLKKKLEKMHPFIEFLGHKGGKELVKLYQNCKFFVLPSTAEGFGLVWIEALACGKPIIASNVGEGPYLIKNKNFGRLVKNVHSIKDIVKEIKSLNMQIEKEGIKSKEIREFIEKNYSWEPISKKYLKLYKSILR